MNRPAASFTATPIMRWLAAAALCLIGNAAMAQVQDTTTAYQYDANGNLTQITDPLGRITHQTYDALNRITQQLQPPPAAGAPRPVIGYTYDGLDQLTTVTDPRHLITTYTTDGLGNATGVTSPDTGATGATYDDAGNLITQTDARGKVTTYTYDALNRLTQATYARGAPTTFTYDGGLYGKGHLTRLNDESGHTVYRYNRFGRLTRKIQTMKGGTPVYSVGYRYGKTGGRTSHLTRLIYPSGHTILYQYDDAGRIHAVKLIPAEPATADTEEGAATGIDPGILPATAIPLLRGITYAPFGPPIAWIWGNSAPGARNTYARSVDLDGRITSYPLGNALNNGTMRTVAYDAASRIQTTTHTGSGSGNATPANFNQSYGYDDLDRLTRAVTYSSSQGYQYDANGNRTQLTIGGTAYANAIAATSNRLTGTSGPSPAKTNAYDNAGNLTADGTIRYTYSDRGRMASATTGAGTTSYRYNGLGQRVSKAGSAIATGANHYVYDEAGHLIGEYDATGHMIEETVYLGDMPVAVLTQSVTGTAPNTTTTVNVNYVYADHLNTPRVITRTIDNKMVWRWDDADPYGMAYPDENPSELGTFTYNPRFPGQYYDAESNLVNNGFRDYDPQIGRYIESDPIGLAGGSFSTYSYVGGNPINKVDPSGLVEWSGTVLSISAGYGPLGVGVDIYTLRSACIDGERTIVKVLSKYLPVGAGSPWSYTGSNVNFNDHLILPDPTSFNGDYYKVSVGAAMGGGYSYGYTHMGDAESSLGGGIEAGFDLGIGATVGGKAEVIFSRTEPCTCGK